MIMDNDLELADSLAVTASAITDVIDLSTTLRDVGNIGRGGRNLYLVLQVDTAFDAVGAATATFSLESDSTANLATSATVHSSTAAIGKAALVAGYTVILPLPPGEYERYLGVRVTVATGPFTAGALSAFITDDIQTWKSYADAI